MSGRCVWGGLTQICERVENRAPALDDYISSPPGRINWSLWFLIQLPRVFVHFITPPPSGTPTTCTHPTCKHRQIEFHPLKAPSVSTGGSLQATGMKCASLLSDQKVLVFGSILQRRKLLEWKGSRILLIQHLYMWIYNLTLSFTLTLILTHILGIGPCAPRG